VASASNVSAICHPNGAGSLNYSVSTRNVLSARSKGKKLSFGTFCASSKKPSAAVNIEFHNALVPHSQQEGLASFLVGNIGSFHDLMHLEWLFAKSTQDFVAIIEHARSLSLGVSARY
jgi:hypothetical protein